MSVANSKKAAPSNANLELAGAVARIRRRGGSSRLGRRSALLGVLTSMYANTSRGTGSARPSSGEARPGTDRA